MVCVILPISKAAILYGQSGVINIDIRNYDRIKWSCSVVSDSLRPHGLEPTRLLHSWNFPGKSSGVACHFLLQWLNKLYYNSLWAYTLKILSIFFMRCVGRESYMLIKLILRPLWMQLDLKRKEQEHGPFYRMTKEIQKKDKKILKKNKKHFWTQITCTIINENDLEQCQSAL